MSVTSHVFFDSSIDMDSLVEEIAQILDAEARPSQSSRSHYVFIVKAANLRCYLNYNMHELDDLTQQTYRFYLYIFPEEVGDDGLSDALIEGAEFVFEKIKATGRFPVMAVFNLQQLLAEFIPNE